MRAIAKRRAHLGGMLDNAAEIVDDLTYEIASGGPTGAHVILNLRTIRDLARWAGARKVGRTLDEACHALASAWFGGVRLSRAMLGDPRARTRWQRVRLWRRAHESGRSLAEQRDHDAREQARTDIIGAIQLDSKVGRLFARRGAERRGNAWCEGSATLAA